MTDTDKIKQELPSQEEVDAAMGVIGRIRDCVSRLSGNRGHASIIHSFHGASRLNIDHSKNSGIGVDGTNLREMIDELFPSPEDATRIERERLEREREELKTKLKENTEALEALK